MGEVLGEADIGEHVAREGRVERIEEFVVVIGGHSRAKLVEEGVLDIALGVPQPRLVRVQQCRPPGPGG